jgi:hypothetical protein
MYQLNTNLASRILHISTSLLPETSFQNGTKSHIKIQLKNPIVCNAHTEHILVSLHSLSAPMSFFNITERETTLQLIEGGVPRPLITVDPGNYSIKTLLATLKTKMNAVSSFGPNEYNLTFNSQQNRVYITAATSSPKILNFNVSNSLSKALGFNKISYSFTTNLVSENAISLYDKLSLYIRTSLAVAGALDGEGNLTDILERVPIKASGSILYFEPPASIFKQLLDRNIVDTFELRISYDDGSEYVDFHGLDYELSLRFDIVRDLERGERVDIRDVIAAEEY